MWEYYVSAFVAWMIAAFTLLFSASLANPARFVLYSKALWKFNFVGALVLVYIAIDIISPFPFLGIPLSESGALTSNIPFVQDLLETTKFSFFMLLGAVLLGTIWALKTTKNEEGENGFTEGVLPDETLKELRDDSIQNLRLMTLLPIAVQFWVMVATDQILSPGEAIATGLFILSGPASWQFAIRVVLFSKNRRSGLRQVTFTLFLSLIGTMMATFFGLSLKQQPNLINAGILPYLASFTLIIVPYSFFYSHWGEKWRDDRPLGIIIGLIIFAMFTSLTISDSISKFFVLSLAWFVLLIFPYVSYSQEFLSEDFSCPGCATKERSPVFRAYMGRKYCMICRTPVPVDRSLIEEKSSLLSWLRLLSTGFLLRLSTRNILVEVDPKQDEYNVADSVKIKVSVARRTGIFQKHPISCKVRLEVKYEKTSMVVEESNAKSIMPNTADTFVFNFIVPTLASKRVPKQRERVTIIAEIALLGFKPRGKEELLFPRAFRRKHKASIAIRMAPNG